MSHERARPPTRTLRRATAVGAVVAAAITGTFLVQSASSDVHPLDQEVVVAEAERVVTPADGVVNQDDGVLPDGTTVFDEQYAGIAQVDPELLQAFQEAAMDAADDGVEFYVASAWRSAEYQQQLLDDAVATYGSIEEAARWVATPSTSLHVSGDAVDIDNTAAQVWLSQNGAEYGLCQIYVNEPWHYELRPEAIDDGCPTMYADPTHDPRLQ